MSMIFPKPLTHPGVRAQTLALEAARADSGVQVLALIEAMRAEALGHILVRPGPRFRAVSLAAFLSEAATLLSREEA